MEITKLIWVYEQLLPIYKKAYDENWSAFTLRKNSLNYGICKASFSRLDIYIYELFYSYYKNIILHNHYLFPKPKTGKGLKPRIEFMESEIKDLKRLIKKGYTHI